MYIDQVPLLFMLGLIGEIMSKLPFIYIFYFKYIYVYIYILSQNLIVLWSIMKKHWKNRPMISY